MINIITKPLNFDNELKKKKEFVLQSFDWYRKDFLDMVYTQYNLEKRFNYGLPISLDEYFNFMGNLVLSLNDNFNNKTNFKNNNLCYNDARGVDLLYGNYNKRLKIW